MPKYPEFKDLKAETRKNLKYKAARVARQGCSRCLSENGHTPDCGK